MSEHSNDLPIKDSVAAVWIKNDKLKLDGHPHEVYGNKLMEVAEIPGQPLVEEYLSTARNVDTFGRYTPGTEGMGAEQIRMIQEEAAQHLKQLEQDLVETGNTEALALLKAEAEKNKYKSME